MKKHIVCFGDSNTHGYCADPSDTVTGGARFDETERWTCLLQQKLGEEYLVLEEGPAVPPFSPMPFTRAWTAWGSFIPPS